MEQIKIMFRIFKNEFSPTLNKKVTQDKYLITKVHVLFSYRVLDRQRPVRHQQGRSREVDKRRDGESKTMT